MTSVVLASLLCALPPARGAARPADQLPAQPLAEDEVRERIDTFLRTIDTRISADQWRALGAYPWRGRTSKQLAGRKLSLPPRRTATRSYRGSISVKRSVSPRPVWSKAEFRASAQVGYTLVLLTATWM